jgi:enoyl-CoA hydratase
MNYTYLKSNIDSDGICLLTISSPATLNALNSGILSELGEFMDSIDSSSVRVLIITGEGKSFVAGADISQMSSFNDAQALEFARKGSAVFKKIEELDLPVIAAVNGFALGGGCELALSCDIRIASEKASFGQPEVNLGIIPGFSGTLRLTKIVGQGVAKELIYTGKRIFAAEALRVGLVNEVVSPELLMETAYKMASDIISSAPVAVKYAKKCINGNYSLSTDDAIALENKYFSKCFLTKDQKEGMSAFLGKRKPSFKNE